MKKIVFLDLALLVLLLFPLTSGWARNNVIFFFFFGCLINLSYEITDFDDVNQWMHVAPSILIFHVRPRGSQEPQTEIKSI